MDHSREVFLLNRLFAVYSQHIEVFRYVGSRLVNCQFTSVREFLGILSWSLGGIKLIYLKAIIA